MDSNIRKSNSGELIFCFVMATLMMSVLIYFIQWKISRRRLYKMALKIPMVENANYYPVIGHAMEFVGDTENILRRITKFNNSGPCPPRTVWLAYRLFHLITRPEDMEVILCSSRCLSKDDLYKMSVPLVGMGLFSLPVPTWKTHRKIIMPTFNQRILDNFVGVFSAQAEICAKMLAKTNSQLIDLFHYLGKYGLDAVCETAMGVKINAQTTESEMESCINRGLDIMTLRMFNVQYHPDFIFNITSLGKEQKKLVKKYHDFVNKVIHQKKEEFRKRKVEQNMNEVESKRKAFLDLLIELTENGENWSNEDLRGEVSTFMIAGSDTSATVGAFTALLLAMHQDIQQKCYEEVMEVLGPHRTLHYTDLPKFVYLEKVIKESMRIFPVGPNIVRKVDEDIEVGGYTLPKGAGIVLSIMSMHRAEQYYKDPFKFDPERFTPEEIAKRHKFAYLPFSGGPRNCVGPKYGIMSLKTILAILIRNFRFETIYKAVTDIRVKQSLIIKAVDGFPIRMIPRHQK